MQVDRAKGMALTGWVGLAILTIGGLMVMGSHVACEVRGRDECLRKSAEPVIALLAGTGLLFTHSPAEGAMAAARSRRMRRRRLGDPVDPTLVPMDGRDPREIYDPKP